MVTLKALALIAGLFSSNALASVGAYELPVLNFASQSYLNGNLNLTVTQRKEIECYAKVVWFEARGESKRGKILVANVVRNRLNYGKPFATTVCDVVYQRNQFAWTRDSKKKHVRYKSIAVKYSKNESKQVADALNVAVAMVVFNPPAITTATHFCSIGEKCNFKSVRGLGKYGNHTLFEYLGNR